MLRNWESEPTISLKEAAILYNTGIEHFRLIFRRELSKTVRFFRNRHGYRLLLTDVMRAAFPEADDYTIHMMALDFVCRSRISRKIKYGGKPTL